MGYTGCGSRVGLWSCNAAGSFSFLKFRTGYRCWGCCRYHEWWLTFSPASSFPNLRRNQGMILLDGKGRVRSPSKTRSPRARRGPESSPCKAVGIMPERFVTPQSPTRPRIATAHAIRTSRSPGLPRASGQQRSVTPSKRTPRGAKRINSLPNSEVNTPKKTRSGSVVPSSQSPSPLKSPTAKAVQDQLVSILEDHNERGRQASLSEDKGRRSASAHSNNPFPGKKARPLRTQK